MRRLEIYWSFIDPAEPGSLYMDVWNLYPCMQGSGAACRPLSESLLMRIPLRYHSGQNADTFVSFIICFARMPFSWISLLEAALVIPLCGVMLREAASPFSDYSSIMIYAVFCC